ncbi:MAG: hybrid sensor histidine kinase/response regulator, partial [bacterium]|nr:hybrid sensor histidine kinase/response regulator [bacterium]
MDSNEPAMNVDPKPFILIVDDVPKNLQIVANILNAEGYRFTLASSGQQALKIIKKRLPDLILLDIMMPEMDGYQVCRTLKRSDRTKDIPVIFLTAKTETSDIVKGFESGGLDYITKPFHSTEMLARIKTHLKIVRVSRERKELLHILCHDLVNPLSSISAILQITFDMDKFDRFRNHLLTASANGLKVIDLVRKLRALEDNKIRLKFQTIDLQEVMEEAELLMQHKLLEKNISFIREMEPGLIVWAERTSLLNSVINNLLTNAIKFSFPDSTINVFAAREGDMVILTVKDSGIGIPEELQLDIFDLKKPTTRTGTNGETGTGYGMPLVNKFINAYGGSIEIYSKEEKDDPENHGTEI